MKKLYTAPLWGVALSVLFISSCVHHSSELDLIESYMLAEGPCWRVPDVWVRTVSDELHFHAFDHLAGDEFKEIYSDDVVNYLGMTVVKNNNIPRTLLEEEITNLKFQKHRAYEFSIGSFSRFDSNYLDMLMNISKTRFSNSLRYFFVEAKVGYTGTGSFTVDFCGEELKVVHRSLGRDKPITSTVPIIVFVPGAIEELDTKAIIRG